MSIGKKLAWSAGSTGALMSQFALSTYISIYYVDRLKMDLRLFSFGMVLYAIWNAINDPLLGHLSDCTRGRRGRRIPYILWGAIPLAAAFALLWLRPHFLDGVNGPWSLLFFIGTLCLFDTIFTMVVLNWSALYPEMYTTRHERANMAVLRQIFGVLGLCIGMALPPLFLGPKTGTAGGWAAMGVIIGSLTAVTMLISVAGSQETMEFRKQPKMPFGRSLRISLSNPSFVTFGFANMAVNFGYCMLTGIFPFYAKYVLQVEGMKQTLLFAAFFGSALLVMPIWAKITVRHGARSVLAASAMIFALGTIPFVVATSFAGGLIVAALVGLGLSALISIGDVALSDIIDEDEVQTGVRREGMYFGLNGFFMRLSVALQISVMGAVLSSTGFDAERAAQTARAILGLRALISPAVIGASLLAVLLLWAYPLHGRRLAQVEEKQTALRKAKAQSTGTLNM